MPANLPPNYYELEREFKAEKDPREKLRLAQELLALMPKHKGTDKLQADLKAKISKLKKQIEGGEKSHGARQAPTHDHIEKEGAGQVILVGAPNSGKSSLIDSLTHAKPMVGDYPFTTREPLAGMMDFETIQIQLIDTPPISPESFENYLSPLIRNADLVVLVADLASATMADSLRFVLEKLEEKRILLRPEVGECLDDPRFCIKKTLICGHKEYDDESGEKQAELAAMFPEYSMVTTSIIDDDSLAEFKQAVFKALSIIRVYTKPVGREADFADPVILPTGGTVEEAAEVLHKDFARKFKFAKIWGHGKFDGQRVQRDFRLSDGDILEFHV
ncbi:MAG: 50S ribosome-binding GTPase [candidate division Zixibacteria bacterium]|nr:50S ribosome-binding GTPase [candidate division Zixibacteria bacterium]